MTISYPMAMFMMCVYADLHLRRVVGMILAGETRSARRKSCLSATLSITNFMWIGLAMDTGRRHKFPKTERLNHDTNMKIWNSNK